MEPDYTPYSEFAASKRRKYLDKVDETNEVSDDTEKLKKTKNSGTSHKQKELVPLEQRANGAKFQLRHGFAENYEPKVTDRESWWRTYIRETPIPNYYPMEQYDLVDDLQHRYPFPTMAVFKSSGRDRDPPIILPKGAVLLPGAYKHKDFVDEIKKHRATFCFKTEPRTNKDILNFGKKDKDVNVPPNAYGVEKYDAIQAEKTAVSKLPCFKSQVQRFPTIHFVPKQGPSPGEYECTSSLSRQSVSSCFKSKTPRFKASHTKVPGPGTYHPTYRPDNATIKKMGKEWSLFFTPEYNHLLSTTE